MGIGEKDTEGKKPEDMTLGELIEAMMTEAVTLHRDISCLGEEIPDSPYSNAQMAQAYRQTYNESVEPLKKELDRREQKYINLYKTEKQI